MTHPPHWGLVCLTNGPEIRFRTTTRSRHLALSPAEREAKLTEIYAANVERLQGAAAYCGAHGIGLYRMSSALFPMLDLWHDGERDAAAKAAFETVKPALRAAVKAFENANVRVTMHPDQFVVLNSDSPEVRLASLRTMCMHAMVLDEMGLPQSPYSMLLLHGGKKGRRDALLKVIETLPHNVRSRLALENDERAYGAAEILEICRASGVPFVFDAHHHVVHAGLSGFADESVTFFTEQAATTWAPPEWQVVHLSNGIDGPNDRRHSWLAPEVPEAFLRVPWVEVEAKGKEEAVFDLQRRYG